MRSVSLIGMRFLDAVSGLQSAFEYYLSSLKVGEDGVKSFKTNNK
jgi:hypothetical protein